MKTRNLKWLWAITLMALVGICPLAKGALWYESGYNTFTDSDPQGQEVFVTNNAVLDFLSGTASLRLFHTATANLYGGSILFDLYASDNSITNIYLINLDVLVADGDSVVNFFAYDVNFYNTGGINNEGYMTGIFFQNNVSFAVDFWNPQTVSHVNIVPEPTTLLFIGIGALLARKSR